MLGIDAGEVAAGKLADLLVVEGDASADVAALEKVLAVFLGGELVP
jgi:imidazolonepropionase-like amidohydrolase